MRPYVVNIITLLSLALCALTLWLWAMGLVGETIRIAPVRDGFALASIDAGDAFVTDSFGRTGGHVIRRLRNVSDEQHGAAGFAYETGTLSGARYWVIVTPYWFVAALTAILPIRWWLLRRRRRERVTTGRCLGCGYDLRGSPERCPECGTSNGEQPASVSVS